MSNTFRLIQKFWKDNISDVSQVLRAITGFPLPLSRWTFGCKIGQIGQNPKVIRSLIHSLFKFPLRVCMIICSSVRFVGWIGLWWHICVFFVLKGPIHFTPAVGGGIANVRLLSWRQCSEVIVFLMLHSQIISFTVEDCWPDLTPCDLPKAGIRLLVRDLQGSLGCTLGRLLRVVASPHVKQYPHLSVSYSVVSAEP